MSDTNSKRSGKSSATRTRKRSSKSTGQTLADGMTCEPFRRLPPNIGGAMLSAAGSHAPTSALREKWRGSTESIADCGASISAPFARYSRDSSSWRTSQRCLGWEWEEFSGIWPRAGMMQSGNVYRLLPLVPRISGTGCLFLPTPRALEQGSYTLDRGDKTKRRLSLTGRARLHHFLATPNAVDYKAGYCDLPHRQQKSLPRDVARALGLISGKRGRLNPEKTGWMMGFPAHWLRRVLGLSATPSSHKSPNGSASES